MNNADALQVICDQQKEQIKYLTEQLEKAEKRNQELILSVDESKNALETVQKQFNDHIYNENENKQRMLDEERQYRRAFAASRAKIMDRLSSTIKHHSDQDNLDDLIKSVDKFVTGHPPYLE